LDDSFVNKPNENVHGAGLCEKMLEYAVFGPYNLTEWCRITVAQFLPSISPIT
jgi:hypothetical protein